MMCGFLTQLRRSITFLAIPCFGGFDTFHNRRVRPDTLVRARE
jgi:hypothetical protein